MQDERPPWRKKDRDSFSAAHVSLQSKDAEEESQNTPVKFFIAN
jgi:hypothetical protein